MAVQNAEKRLLSQRTEQPLLSGSYRCAQHFRPRFRKQSTGTFGTEIKGTPIHPQSSEVFPAKLSPLSINKVSLAAPGRHAIVNEGVDVGDGVKLERELQINPALVCRPGQS